jgi:hypothetical protein
MRSNGFAENVVTEISDGGFAGDETMLIQHLGNRTIRSPLLTQFADYVFGGKQILMLLRTARSEVLNRLADIGWIKRGHRADKSWDILWTTR